MFIQVTDPNGELVLILATAVTVIRPYEYSRVSSNGSMIGTAGGFVSCQDTVDEVRAKVEAALTVNVNVGYGLEVKSAQQSCEIAPNVYTGSEDK